MKTNSKFLIVFMVAAVLLSGCQKENNSTNAEVVAMMISPEGQEKRIQSFDESIPFIEQIDFSYGGYFYGYESRKITFSKENVSLDVDYVLQGSEDKKPFVRKFPGMKRDFLEAFASLHIGEWKTHYYNSSVLDGSSWNLTIRFSNGHREVKKEGTNAYPYNFNDFYELMKLEENDEFSGESSKFQN